MEQKFALGLFEKPFVDPDSATMSVGAEAYRAAGIDAQKRSLVLLENDGGLLPLKATGANGPLRVYAVGIDTGAVRRAGWSVASDPAQADVAIVRLEAPFETLHPGYVFGAMQHEGTLAFHEGMKKYDDAMRLSAQLPTVVTVYLDRPAVLTPLKGKVENRVRQELARRRSARVSAQSLRNACARDCRRPIPCAESDRPS